MGKIVSLDILLTTTTHILPIFVYVAHAVGYKHMHIFLNGNLHFTLHSVFLHT
jgi:hypothetical protein